MLVNIELNIICTYKRYELFFTMVLATLSKILKGKNGGGTPFFKFLFVMNKINTFDKYQKRAISWFGLGT